MYSAQLNSSPSAFRLPITGKKCRLETNKTGIGEIVAVVAILKNHCKFITRRIKIIWMVE